MTYRELSRMHHVMKSASKPARKEAAGMEFVDALRRLLREQDSLKALNRRQTWQVLAWCSSYRPEPMHCVVRAFARLVDV